MENTSVGASQVPPISEKQLAPSMQTLVTQEQTHHMIENSPPSNQGSKTLRMWKRLARDNPTETNPPLSPTAKKRSREEDVEYLLELPTKGRKSEKSNGGGYSTVPPSAMSLIVWNCHGLGNLRIGKELEVVIRAKHPSIVFLVETWVDEVRLKEVQRNIKFDNMFYVEKNLRSGGGLALYWKNSIDVCVDSFSKYHIDSIINKGSDEAWRFKSFYGEPITHMRVEAWNNLRLLNTKHNLPWFCARDFNEITRSSEKLGGNNRSQAQMKLFRDVIDECRFLDLSYVGDKFTWRKHFVDGHSLWERLDCGLANHEWFMKFTGTKIHHLLSDSLDHSPLWITLDGLDIPSFAKPFRFKEMWLSNRGCSDIIEAVWLSRGEEEDHDHVMHKIDKCGKELHKWERDCFRNVKLILSRKRKDLKEAKKLAMRTGNNQHVRMLQKDIAELIDKENRLWFQNAKVTWAKFGNRNSKFFHSHPS